MATISTVVDHVSASARALQTSTDTFLRWHDAEVASALEGVAAANQQERLLRIDLQNQLQTSEQNLRACEKHLKLLQKSEQKITCDLQKANADSTRAQQLETEVKTITDALAKIGIRLLKDTEGEFVWLQLICDLDADVRWAQVQRQYFTEYEHRDGIYPNRPLHGPFGPLTSQRSFRERPLDAIAAIDALLGALNMHITEKYALSVRCDTVENEVAQLKTELEAKNSRIAELEVMVASHRGEESSSAGGVPTVTCIRPSQLMKDSNYSPYLSEASGSSPISMDPFLS
ncbi:hypothetical protein F5050DRAFT_1773131 [Lentinula boryana]|uniref:Fungal N-terminal domain-containing protein n=1 Tax=Lentinula boryana TaxID=40481 RepID=A0ABQ8Q818_9AGAR|nr:hypothetical protein F5050DRAFT_1773131 [Lentinula boryana]